MGIFREPICRGAQTKNRLVFHFFFFVLGPHRRISNIFSGSLRQEIVEFSKRFSVTLWIYHRFLIYTFNGFSKGQTLDGRSKYFPLLEHFRSYINKRPSISQLNYNRFSLLKPPQLTNSLNILGDSLFYGC